MKINKTISALLCSVAMCCSNGQVSKTSASLLGHFFSVAAAQQWIQAASWYYTLFESKRFELKSFWFQNLFFPIYSLYLNKQTIGDEDVNNFDVTDFSVNWSEGLKQVSEALSRLDHLPSPVLFTYLAREEFRKEKENNKKVSDKNMHVDQKNDKGKKDSNNSK